MSHALVKKGQTRPYFTKGMVFFDLWIFGTTNKKVATVDPMTDGEYVFSIQYQPKNTSKAMGLFPSSGII